jgi:hypothetical protein
MDGGGGGKGSGFCWSKFLLILISAENFFGKKFSP